MPHFLRPFLDFSSGGRVLQGAKHCTLVFASLNSRRNEGYTLLAGHVATLSNNLQRRRLVCGITDCYSFWRDW